MIFPNINPIAFSIGPINVYWYSVSYIISILLGWFYANKIVTKFTIGINKKHLEDFVTWSIIGIIIGGRLGYVILYNPIVYFSNPIRIFKTYEGGMSFHGGMIGLIIATYFFCLKYKIKFFSLIDILSTVAPIGLFFGRIANFINGELYGRITNTSFAMVFPNSDLQMRHPSQLYEAALEGIILFFILAYITFKYNTIKVSSLNSAIFLIFYSIFRIIVETFREPDFHIGFILYNLTIGQILSLPMLLGGIYLIVRLKCSLTLK